MPLQCEYGFEARTDLTDSSETGECAVYEVGVKVEYVIALVTGVITFACMHCRCCSIFVCHRVSSLFYCLPWFQFHSMLWFLISCKNAKSSLFRYVIWLSSSHDIRSDWTEWIGPVLTHILRTFCDRFCCWLSVIPSTCLFGCRFVSPVMHELAIALFFHFFIFPRVRFSSPGFFRTDTFSSWLQVWSSFSDYFSFPSCLFCSWSVSVVDFRSSTDIANQIVWIKAAFFLAHLVVSIGYAMPCLTPIDEVAFLICDGIIAGTCIFFLSIFSLLFGIRLSSSVILDPSASPCTRAVALRLRVTAVIICFVGLFNAALHYCIVLIPWARFRVAYYLPFALSNGNLLP